MSKYLILPIIIFIVCLALFALLAILPATIAKNKGKSFKNWYIYGLFFWLIATIHAIRLPELENFKSVVSVHNKKFDLNSPVEILNYEILKAEKGSTSCHIHFRNLNVGFVTAIKLEAEAYNSFDEPVMINADNKFPIILQDLNISRLQLFKTEVPIELPNNEIRKLVLFVKQVRFSSGKIINIDSPQIIEPIINPITNEDELRTIKQLQSSAICYATQSKDYWVCTCGYPNKNDVDNCAFCETEKERAFNTLNQEHIISIITERKRQEKDAKEAEKIKEKNVQKRVKKILKITLVVFIIIACVGFGTSIIISNMNYQKELNLIKSYEKNAIANINNNNLDQAAINYQSILQNMKSTSNNTLRNYEKTSLIKITKIYGNKAIQNINSGILTDAVLRQYIKDNSTSISSQDIKKVDKEILSRINNAYTDKTLYYLSNNDIENASKIYQILSPENNGSKEKIVNAFYNKGIQLENSFNYEKAISCLNIIGDYNDSNFKLEECHYKLGNQYYAAGDYKNALQNFLSAENYQDAQNKFDETYKKCEAYGLLN